MPTPTLFAYGTLRDADVLALVLGRPVASELLQPAVAPGHRVVFFPGRSYPAIRLDPAATAIGTLIAELSAADFSRLDTFEGEEYSRRIIEIIVSGEARQAHVYWPVLPVGETAEWRLADWVARHKTAFVATETETIAQLRRRLDALPST